MTRAVAQNQHDAITVASDQAGPLFSTYLPLGIDLAGKVCLVVGGGRVGERKARSLMAYRGSVRVVSPQATQAIQAWADSGQLDWFAESYRPEMVDEAFLVVAATSDKALNARIGQDAEQADKLCCVASSAGRSRMIFPARWDGPDVTVAVHTHGRNCRHASRIRDRLAAHLAAGPADAAQLQAVGIDLDKVPPSVATRLRQLSADEMAASLPDSGMLLATCRRWEFYTLADRPRECWRQLRDALLAAVDDLTPAMVQHRHGLAAFHHLLRIAAGLDSSLIGETDVVGQLRDAADAAAASDPLRCVIDEVLSLQRGVRQDAGLGGGSVGWGRTIADSCRQHVIRRGGGTVIVAGCGSLGEAAVRELSAAGVDVAAFSNRGETLRESWASRYAISPQPMSTLDHALASAAAIVLCTRLTDDHRERLAHASLRDRPLILDLDGGHTALRRTGGVYRGARDIGHASLDGPRCAAAARAESKTIEASLRWWRQRHPLQPPAETLRIGARGSALSRRQIGEFTSLLETLLPGVRYCAQEFSSPGDRDRGTPLPTVTDDDFFTRDIDRALLDGDIDLAVHSAKDLPSHLAAGLTCAAVLPSVARWDALVTRNGSRLHDLPAGAVIGTSSQRRADNLRALRNDLAMRDIRGNVPDRMAQLDHGDYDGLILAVAGLVRLGLEDRIAEVLSISSASPASRFPVAPGQGSLAVIVRSEDHVLREVLRPLDLADREDRP